MFPPSPKRICIVGAGPAGLRLAIGLADRGREALVLDHRVPWEKPCGGGLTPRAAWLIPQFTKLDLHAREHSRFAITFPSGRRVKMSLTLGMFTVSRQRLGQCLLDQALRAGARFSPEKVRSVRVEGETAVVATDAKEYEADLVVGADGVNGLVRRTLVGPFPRADLCLSFCALLPPAPHLPVALKFFKRAPGYAWIFPRREETSVGIAMEDGRARPEQMKEALGAFVADEFQRAGRESPPLGVLRGRYLPALRSESFVAAEVCGPGWALIGDASGACDPLTGEGIFYALQTAHFLERAIMGENPDYLNTYRMLWKGLMVNNLARASNWRTRFYQPRNLNLLGLGLDYSPMIRQLTRELVAGTQDYYSLKERILVEWRDYLSEGLQNLIMFRKGEQGG